MGLAGVGLMGHGIARNLLRRGHTLRVLAHPGNQPLDELLQGGATVVDTAQALADVSEVILLCVTGTPEVEAVLTGPAGVLQGLRPGSTVIDCSTAVPGSTLRMAALVTAAGGRFLDAPMTRTAQHAHAGTLNLLVGGDAGLLAEMRPLLSAFAENITHAGPVGAGHRLKLLHNFVSLGSMALLAEAAACAARGGIAPEVLVDVLASGGGAGVALERLRPVILDPAGPPMPFAMGNALKDLRYYLAMAEAVPTPHAIAEAVLATYDMGVVQAGVQAMVTELVAELTRMGPAPSAG